MWLRVLTLMLEGTVYLLRQAPQVAVVAVVVVVVVARLLMGPLANKDIWAQFHWEYLLL